MRHPNQATLALHAGGDLGPIKRWFTARHVAGCGLCREEIAGFEEMRELLPELAELPDISWNRMAAEIKANVRLGLEAGECVKTADLALPRHTAMAGWRPVVAFASVLVLVGGCLVLERPTPAPPAVAHASGPSVESTDEGILRQDGDTQLSFKTSGARRVSYLSAQGAGVRTIDAETGTVTISTLYVQ